VSAVAKEAILILHLTLPEDERTGDLELDPLAFTFEGLVQTNLWHIRRARKLGRPLPSLYGSGVRYKDDDPHGQENWRDIPAVLRAGGGDCDRLSAWRIAELRDVGIAARPRFDCWRVPKDALLSGPARHDAHVRVEHPDGRIEDPSEHLNARERGRHR